MKNHKCLLTVFFMLIFILVGCGKQSYLETKSQSEKSQQSDSHQGSRATGSSNTAAQSDKKSNKNTNSKKTKTKKTSDDTPWVVCITGAVNQPGVFHVKEDTRVYEVIKLAGGFRSDAEQDSLNQAAAVSDGEMIRILTVEEAKLSNSPEVSGQSQSQTQDGKSTGGKVSLNRASKEELMTLPGIGESKADAIIKYREENGSFRSIDDLKKISGIKDGVISKFKDKVVI